VQGNITIGLYTDNLCSYEYEGSEFDAWTLSGYSEYYFDEFNRALDSYKICQPCVSYDLTEENFQCVMMKLDTEIAIRCVYVKF
jgi:hypothetical protein